MANVHDFMNTVRHNKSSTKDFGALVVNCMKSVIESFVKIH